MQIKVSETLNFGVFLCPQRYLGPVKVTRAKELYSTGKHY